jgi:hypothetical protein
MKTKQRMMIAAIAVVMPALSLFALKAAGAAGKFAAARIMPPSVTEGIGFPHGGRAGAMKPAGASRLTARQNNKTIEEGLSRLVFDKTQPVRRAPETATQRSATKRIESLEIPREGAADPALFPLPKKAKSL